MEFDALKNTWQNDQPGATPEISLEKQKEIHLPLEKIRKNMRMEFWVTVIALASILIFFEISHFEYFKLKVYVITLVGSMILVTHFYFYKFFLLYKNLGTIDLNVKDNLKDLNLQLKLNEQYYLSFYLSFVPFAIAEMLIIFEFSTALKSLDGVPFVLAFVAGCLFLLIFLFTSAKWWFKRFYGKHIKVIELQIETLN